MDTLELQMLIGDIHQPNLRKADLLAADLVI
jgi:hypothetical protein